MAEKLDKLEAQLEELGGQLEKLREQIRNDEQWEKEDLEEMVLEVFDDIGKRLDHLLSKL